MEDWGWLWILAVLLIAAGLIIWAVCALRRKVRAFSRTAFGTASLAKGWAAQQERLSREPKSVSGMTKLYLPQIAEDFPQFQYEEFRGKAENALRAALLAISAQDASGLKGLSDAFQKQVKLRIADAKGRGEREVFEDITIHRTEISRYRKEAGRCIITLQSAVGYRHYVLAGSAVKSGSKERLEQTKYNLDFLYIQDAEQVKGAEGDKAVGLTCPNCGAPVTALGLKRCEYCGLEVKEVNLYAWELSGFAEAA